jgi:hypothetical protein
MRPLPGLLAFLFVLNAAQPVVAGVATLVEREVEAGHHEVAFDASGLSSGVYFYRLTAAGFMDP